MNANKQEKKIQQHNSSVLYMYVDRVLKLSTYMAGRSMFLGVLY
jgi:hypothetical protein